jgi:hypothetical protein
MEGIMTDVKLEAFYDELSRAVMAHDRVPDDVVGAAKASFAWRSVDDELAALVYDSADDTPALVGVRGGSARQLTFEAGELTIELEVGGATRGVVGQLSPAQAASIEFRHDGGSAFVDTDALGRFGIERVPDGPVSLRLLPAGGGRVATDWVRL